MSILSDDVCETLMLTSQGVKSGLSFPEAIRLSLGDASESGVRLKGAQKALLRLAEKIEQGVEPKVAIRQVGLPTKLVDLLDVSLESRDFGTMFDQLVKIEENRTSTFRLMMQSMPYFLLLLLASIGIFLFLMIFVLPQFEEIFDSFDTSLPLLTQMMLSFSHLIQHPLFWISLILGCVAFYYLTKMFCPRAYFYLPILGTISRSTYRSNFLRQLALQISQNVPLPDALQACGKMMSSSVYRNDCYEAAKYAQYGMSLHDIASKYYWLFPSWCLTAFSHHASSSPGISPSEATQSIASMSEATQAIAVPPDTAPPDPTPGTETTNAKFILKTLNRAASEEFGQKEDTLVLLQGIIVPLCIIFTGSFVGLIVMAMFLPMIKLITELSG